METDIAILPTMAGNLHVWINTVCILLCNHAENAMFWFERFSSMLCSSLTLCHTTISALSYTYLDDEKEWISNGHKILDNKHTDNEHIIEFYQWS